VLLENKARRWCGEIERLEQERIKKKTAVEGKGRGANTKAEDAYGVRFERLRSEIWRLGQRITVRNEDDKPANRRRRGEG
jgi:hypothetical protein